MDSLKFEQINSLSPGDAALRYAEMGWKVFPCQSRGKKPLTVNGFHAATTDRAKISEWWRKWPTANVAVATGSVSGIVALDLDAKYNGLQAYMEVIKSNGSHLPTLEAQTGGGGKHLIFRHPGFDVKNSAGQIAPGVDCRGDGGYLLLSPSVHPNGELYQWRGGPPPALASPPTWLYSPKKPTRALTSDSEVSIIEGGRNHALTRIAGKFRAEGLDEEEMLQALILVNEKRCEPPLSDREVWGIARSVSRYKPSDAVQASRTGYKPSYSDLSDSFLAENSFAIDELVTLRHWRGDFYSWTGSHYQSIKKDELQSEIRSWLRTNARERASNQLVEELLADLRSQGMVKADLELPVSLDGKAYKPNLISLANGVLDLDRLIAGDPAPLRSHDPALFTLTSLPFPYDPSATCPTWEKFLNTSLPDVEIRRHLAEWFGYNLVYDNSQESFCILFGRGANGKSVICKVLRELLGSKNCSGVALENFNVQRSFLMAATVGKLANIIPELNEIEKAQEGLIRQFVSGEDLQAERKNKDPFEFKPTARLTMATNTLPKFSDRTDATWRRLVLIPFPNQFLDTSKQDKRLADPAWWRESGELAGIFNWAVKGLIRYKQRGRFLEPEACKRAKESYQEDSNPTKAWILDNLERDPNGEVESGEVYEKYKSSLEDSSYRPLGKAGFLNEVEALIPGAERPRNAARREGKRRRLIRGVKLRHADTHGTPNSHSGLVIGRSIE